MNVNLRSIGKDFLALYRSLADDGRRFLTSTAYRMVKDEIELLIATKDYDAIGELVLTTLPGVGKMFDQVLSEGRPAKWMYSHFRGRIPFVDSIFGGNFEVHLAIHGLHGLDPSAVFMARQVLYFGKKFELEAPLDAARQAAQEFWAVEHELHAHRSVDTRLLTHAVGGYFSEGLSDSSDLTLRRLVRCLDLLSASLNSRLDEKLDVYDLVPNHGPGAVSNLKKGEDKYTLPDYPRVIADALPAAYFSSYNEEAFRELSGFDERGCTLKVPAKLIAVPKTYTKPRLIASEPVVHQYFQQALMKFLRGNLHATLDEVVDFRSQTPSQELALRSSRDQRCVTVDLSSASDRLSLWAVESYFRTAPRLLDLLVRTRSCEIQDAIDPSNGTRYIKKFAPMGSATTFPVQTMIYATCCFAALAVAENRDHVAPGRLLSSFLRRSSSDIQVFGDDIILPRKAYRNLVTLLEFLKLKVNSDKTHLGGYFREACGMDAYMGYDVTPAYVSHPAPAKTPNKKKFRIGIKTVAYIEQSNNAHRKGLWSLADKMARNLPAQCAALVPSSSDLLGVCTLFSFVSGTLGNIRANSALMKPEVRGITLVPREKVVKRDNDLDLLQYYTEGTTRTSAFNYFHIAETLLRVGTKSSRSPKVKVIWGDARGKRRS